MADDSQSRIHSERKIVSFAEAKELGLDRYFTGLLCKRGHLSERSTKWRACLACQSLKHHEWLKAHPERSREHKHKAYHKDIEASRAKLRVRRRANPEKYRKFAKASYRKHKEKRVKAVREYYEGAKRKMRLLQKASR